VLFRYPNVLYNGLIKGAAFLSKSKNLFARIESDLMVLKWVSGTTLAGVIALVIRAVIA
jgi:hypothetical protein